MIDLENQKETIRKRLEMHFNTSVEVISKSKRNSFVDWGESEYAVSQELIFRNLKNDFLGQINLEYHSYNESFPPFNSSGFETYNIRGPIAILNPEYLLK